MVIVGIPQKTLDWLWEVAVERQRIKDLYKNKSRRHNKKHDDIEVTYHGVVGEYAACKVLGVPFNDQHFDGGDINDGAMPDGRTVEIKTRDQPGRDFALKNHRLASFRADLGILVWPVYKGDYRIMEVAGWIDRNDFANRATIRNYGYGPRLGVYYTAARPLDTLNGTDTPLSHM